MQEKLIWSMNGKSEQNVFRHVFYKHILLFCFQSNDRTVTSFSTNHYMKLRHKIEKKVIETLIENKMYSIENSNFLNMFIYVYRINKARTLTFTY